MHGISDVLCCNDVDRVGKICFWNSRFVWNRTWIFGIGMDGSVFWSHNVLTIRKQALVHILIEIRLRFLSNCSNESHTLSQHHLVIFWFGQWQKWLMNVNYQMAALWKLRNQPARIESQSEHSIYGVQIVTIIKVVWVISATPNVATCIKYETKFVRIDFVGISHSQQNKIKEKIVQLNGCVLLFVVHIRKWLLNENLFALISH